MKFSKEDLPLIRSALLVLGATMLIAVGAVWGSAYFRDRMQQTLDEAQQRLAGSRAKLQQAHDEGQNIRTYLTRYQTLLNRGIVGEEKRLDWIDAITRVKNRRKLFEIDYAISAQQPVAADALLPPGELELRRSRMKISLPLLHEGDLLNLLDDLEGQDKGLVTIQGCEIQRGEGPAGLSASCRLDWLTLKPAVAGGPESPVGPGN